jgi:iron complex transport system permease protein
MNMGKADTARTAVRNRKFDLERDLIAWLVLITALLGIILMALASGRYAVPLGHIVEILLSHLHVGSHGWTDDEEIVIDSVRLPRLIIAGLVGAGLALSGGVLQGVFRNPLVGPQTIGASSGASVGGVAAILFCGFGPAVQIGAFIGSATALAAVLALQRSDGHSPLLTLVLAGVVVSAFCSAVVGLVTFVADPDSQLPGMVFWLLGSFAAADWHRVLLVAVCCLGGGAILLGMRWRVNALSLGDEEARLLGLSPAKDRLILLVAICCIVSAQVAVSGAIGWVGLVVPNLARFIIGADHRRLLPFATLLGAAFMIAADTLARTLTAAEIPVGIITAIIGTPIFAYLLRSVITGADR